jgi:hypothetical protein
VEKLHLRKTKHLVMVGYYSLSYICGLGGKIPILHDYKVTLHVGHNSIYSISIFMLPWLQKHILKGVAIFLQNQICMNLYLLMENP